MPPLFLRNIYNQWVAIMGFDYHVNGDRAQIILTGEIDLQVTGALKSQIDQMRHITFLDMDAGNVTYMDSSGVAVLLYARQAAISHGFQFSISSMSRSVFRILEVARLDTILPIGQVVNNANSSTDAFGLSIPPVSSTRSPETDQAMPLSGPSHQADSDSANPIEEDMITDDMEAAISADLATAGSPERHADDLSVSAGNIANADEQGQADDVDTGDFKPGDFKPGDFS